MVLAAPVTAAPPVDTSGLRDAVTVEGIREHLAALEAIANANPFRASRPARPGRPVTRRRWTTSSACMQAAGYQVTLQPFEADIFFEQAPAVFERVVARSRSSTSATTARPASGTPPTSPATAT